VEERREGAHYMHKRTPQWRKRRTKQLCNAPPSRQPAAAAKKKSPSRDSPWAAHAASAVAGIPATPWHTRSAISA